MVPTRPNTEADFAPNGHTISPTVIHWGWAATGRVKVRKGGNGFWWRKSPVLVLPGPMFTPQRHP